MSDETSPKFAVPSMFVGMDDVRTALEAGFSPDEVVYMLDLENEIPSKTLARSRSTAQPARTRDLRRAGSKG